MPEEPQGLILFEGIDDILEASYSLTHGISPGVATLVVPPQRVFKGLSGTLTIRQKGVVAKFSKCRVDEIEQVIDPQGREVWIVRVLDRRWLWRLCGRISGKYNFKRGTKVLNVKRPQDLANLCLEAMGEKGADVKRLPNDSFPEVDWDYTNPSEALADLCDKLDCRVVLGIDDKLRIVRVNEGRPLRPDNRTLDGGKSVDPGDPPGLIAIVGAPNRWQLDIALRPVGLNPDGRVLPIDRLSYAPRVNGTPTWRFSTFEDFQEIDNIKFRELAQRSVFRWYQIVDKHTLTDIKGVVPSWRILPLLASQVETEKSEDGEIREKAPQVYGRFWRGGETHAANYPNVRPDLGRFPKAEFTDGFSIDSERGIVMLNQPAVLCEFDRVVVPGQPKISGRQVDPAILYLRTSVSLIDQKTRATIRVEWRSKPKGKKADPKQTQYVIREDTGLRYYRDWSAGGIAKDNRKEAAKVARHYLDIEEKKYETKDGGGVTQAGLLKEDVDGAIVQVSWSVSGEGYCSTRISRTKEDLSPSGDFKNRRLFERIDRALKDREKREAGR